MTDAKRAGIVGPTRVPLIEEQVGLESGTLERAAREVGTFLGARSLGMVCVPVRGVPLAALQGYKQAGGRDSLALWPRLSNPSGNATDPSRGNPDLADVVRRDLTWGDEPFELARLAACLVMIGLSCGTLVEAAATKWVGETPVLAVAPLMTQVPAEIACELDLRLFDDMEGLKRGVAEILC